VEPHADVTRQIIGCAIRVANALGVGFLEKVYENALVHELGRNDLGVAQQVPIRVVYDGVVVGNTGRILVVEGTIVVELKAVRQMDPVHEAQLLNYLRRAACASACCSTSERLASAFAG